jgi:hypothetical protein
MKRLLQTVLCGAVLSACFSAAAQAPPVDGVPVHMVVTVEARHGKQPPTVYKDDVMVYQGKDRRPTLDWLPLQGDHAGLQLFILIDDGATTSLGSQLEDLRDFIGAQPASTAIGIAYMRDGVAQVVQNLTIDHALAAKALRLPMGEPGINASPYISLTDLIKRWPEAAERREVLMVTDGIDRLYGGPTGTDPYVDEVIAQAQTAGIIVFSIYNPGVGHYSHSYWRTNWGQSYLSQLSDETGGESYYLSYGAPVSFSPYLDDMAHKLGHQYLLSFSAKPEKKAGIQKVKLHTEVPNAELVAADGVYVPAAAQ